VVNEAADGTAVYYSRTKSDSSVVHYLLDEGVLTEVPTLPTLKRNGFETAPAIWQPTFGYEIDLSDAMPPGAGLAGTVRYRLTDGEWQTVLLNGLATSAAQPFRAAVYDETRLCVATASYFPVCLYTPSTGAVEVQGWTTASLYRLLNNDNDLYLAGYHDAFLRWNTAAAWTLAHNSGDLTLTNPRSVASSGKSHQYICKDALGRVWTASMHVRTSDGCSLVCYDSVADTYSEHRAAWGLDGYNASGLAIAGAYIVVSLRNNDGVSAGRIIIIDSADDSLSLDALQTDVIDPGFLIGLDATHVFAIADYVFYRLSVPSGIKDNAGITYDKLFPDATYPWLRGAQLGADGRIWLMLGTQLYAIEPNTGIAYQAVQNVPVAQRGEVVWLGDTPYLLGNAHIHKLNIPG
jgi:hypothetical protein